MGFGEWIEKRKQTKEQEANLYAQAREELETKLKGSKLFSLLMDAILNDADNPWLYQAQDFHEDGKRFVWVDLESFEIKWATSYWEDYIAGYYSDGQPKRSTRLAEDVHAHVEYSYTKSGFAPLSNYTSSIISEKSGKAIVFSERDVCKTLATLILEHMKSAMKSCSFGSISSSQHSIAYYFEYIVPKMQVESII